MTPPPPPPLLLLLLFCVQSAQGDGQLRTVPPLAAEEGKTAAADLLKNRTGLRIRLTRRGLDYGCAVGGVILEQEIKNIVFPPLAMAITSGPGNGRLTVTKMIIPYLESPLLSYDTYSPNRVVFKSKKGLVNLHGRWEARYKALVSVHLKGYVAAKVTGLNLLLNATLKASADGHPQFDVSKCAASVDSLDIRITGGFVQSILNLFRQMIAGEIEKEIGKAFCSSAEHGLLHYTNRQLETLPTSLPLEEVFQLNYALTRQPMVGGDFIQSELRFDISYANESRLEKIPYPHPLPNPESMSEDGRMLYLLGSDNLLNSLFVSAHEHSLLRLAIGKDLNRRLKGVMETSCHFICIGAFLPGLANKYPNEYVDLVVTSALAPTVLVTHGRADFSATAFVDIYIYPWNVTENMVARCRVDVGGQIRLRMRRRNVIGRLSLDKFTMDIVSSSVGPFTAEAMSLIKKLARPFLQAAANHYLMKGIALPSVQGLRFILPKLTMVDRAVLFETNFAYKLFYARRLLPNYYDKMTSDN